MLSDKLKGRADYLLKFERFATLSADFQERFTPKDEADAHAFTTLFQQLLAVNADMAQAPVLYTLQSAAEVGFAHARLTPVVDPAHTPATTGTNSPQHRSVSEVEDGTDA